MGLPTSPSIPKPACAQDARDERSFDRLNNKLSNRVVLLGACVRVHSEVKRTKDSESFE